MKKSLRILIVISVAASSLLFATPSQAAPTDRWVTAFSPNGFFVKDTSNLSVGSSVSLKTIGVPDNLFDDPFPAGVTITSVSVEQESFGFCGIEYYTCPNRGGFANGDIVYAVYVNVFIFSYWTLAEFTFNGGSSTAPGAPTSVTATATGTTTATLAYTAPASNGGSVILSYTATSTPGSVTATIFQAGSGTISITGLSPGTNYTFTVTALNAVGSSVASNTSNSITTFALGKPVAPMLPTNKPTITLSDTLITCTIGAYSAAPTSAAFSLFVGGLHITTNFSATGDYLPDWITPWATPGTITRTATLTSASWTMSDAYEGKVITCATLAYSEHATGLISSAPLTTR